MNRAHVSFGGDPEFFALQEGKVVESSKVIPKEGIPDYNIYSHPVIIRDGFQSEINLPAHDCRQVMGSYYARIMKGLQRMNIGVQLGHGFWIPDDMFASLTGGSKKFGCNPSANTYNTERTFNDASVYQFRPVGGHIHLGFNKDKVDLRRLVRLLDLFVGNSCVPFDQADNDNAIERRKNYGLPGEYREKDYGLEYRTLSNFWLNHYVLMSMVYGLARQAISIEMAGKSDEFLALVNEEDVIAAIKNNDKSLAIANFKKLVPKIIEYFPVDGEYDEDDDENFGDHVELFTINEDSYSAFIDYMLVGFEFETTGQAHWVSLGNSYSSMPYGIEKVLQHGNN